MDHKNGTGSNSRPTVALAVAKIEHIAALMEVGFSNMQRQLDDMVGLPEDVARLEERVKNIEDDKKWLHGPVLGAATAIITCVLTLIVMLLA